MAVSAPVFVQPLRNDRTAVGMVVVVDIVLDSSYAAGGEPFDPALVGLKEVWFADLVQKSPIADPTTPNYYQFQWDHTNNKIVAIINNNDGVADGPSIEAVATTNLSTFTVRARFYGLPA